MVSSPVSQIPPCLLVFSRLAKEFSSAAHECKEHLGYSPMLIDVQHLLLGCRASSSVYPQNDEIDSNPTEEETKCRQGHEHDFEQPGAVRKHYRRGKQRAKRTPGKQQGKQ